MNNGKREYIKTPIEKKMIITINVPLWQQSIVKWFLKMGFFPSRSEMFRTVFILGIHEFLKAYNPILMDITPSEVDEVFHDYVQEIQKGLPGMKKCIDMKYLASEWPDVLAKLEARVTK